MNTQCPECKGGLYKELLADEKAKLICMRCKWESELIDRHSVTDTESIQEKRKLWA